jgi:hypothetical protein
MKLYALKFPNSIIRPRRLYASIGLAHQRRMHLYCGKNATYALTDKEYWQRSDELKIKIIELTCEGCDEDSLPDHVAVCYSGFTQDFKHIGVKPCGLAIGSCEWWEIITQIQEPSKFESTQKGFLASGKRSVEC